MRSLLFLLLFFFLAAFVPSVYAQNNSFVSIVNPVRGNDFWDVKDQKPETAVLGQIAILDRFNLPTTWLLRFDVFDNHIVNQLKARPVDEKGLFLEVTPTWADQAKVSYHKSASWHTAGSALLTGYEVDEREKLINTAFEKFKFVFGFYPKSVGAWWLDSYSLNYMKNKYNIVSALIVSDQYSTDNYQIWGQYFSTPYYPSKNNALHPAQNIDNKLDIVIQQWAPRDPVNSYGNGVSESTFSVQANDYQDYHNLNTNYFSSLIDIYTKQEFNQFTQVVVGLENSYEWSKYSDEYSRQMEAVSQKRSSNQLSTITLKDFANWYATTFPKLSPPQLIVADDPLGSYKKVIWFMNPYYRVGWFYNQDGSVIRDIRQYIDGEEELCFKTRCDSVNFATSATRVLDDVSFGHKWIIDQGKISDFKVEKQGDEIVINYKNEAGNLRKITLLPRDIGVDGENFSIDGAILNATRKEAVLNQATNETGGLQWSFVSVVSKIGKFLIFLTVAIAVPGLVITRKIFKSNIPFFLRLFISAIAGFVILTLFFYLTGLLRFQIIMLIYILISILVFLRAKVYSNLFIELPKVKNIFNLSLISVIILGTIFQVIPVFKSGLNLGFGLGFWGPNTHDGVWHMALVNQLQKNIPPENPVYASATLKNYHFFYDILIALTNYLTKLPAEDLIFRFYPIIFSLMLGVGSYYLVVKLFEDKIGIRQTKIASLFSLYLIYFAGSFGWIVEFLRERHIGGESAFWANQAVSFNLNPPFAISLIIIIALLHILFNITKNSTKPISLILTILLAGSLIGFKSYGAILILLSILLVGLAKKNISYVLIFLGAVLVSLGIFLPNFDINANLLLLAPFWFIHSMIDSPDRVGWTRLSLAREVGWTTKNWFKYFSAEVISLWIFIVGNLGLRVISLFSLIKIKNIIKDEKFLLIFLLAFFSFLIPIFFIQSGNPWNTIQFLYYGLYLASIASGAVLSSVVFRLPKYISFIIVLLVIILGPINSVVTANGYLGKNPHAFITSKELAGLRFLAQQQSGVVLTYPYDGKLKSRLSEPWPILAYDSTAYVAALSGKSVYLEDEPQNQILLTDYKKRLVASKDFFLNSNNEKREFLHDNNISYIYIPKIYNIKLNEDIGFVKNIFENEQAVIYQVK